MEKTLKEIERELFNAKLQRENAVSEMRNSVVNLISTMRDLALSLGVEDYREVGDLLRGAESQINLAHNKFLMISAGK